MNIGIIGLGLIGGSMGRALVKRTSHTVFGFDLKKEVMLKAKLVEAYNEELTDEKFGLLDVIFIAVYPRAVEDVINKIAPKLKKGALVADLTGIKENIVDGMLKAKEKYPDIDFIATHPMAGREFSGIEHSTENLFDKACALMVNVLTPIEKLVLLKNLFLEIGFLRVVMTNSKEHDELIAYTSQLAHVISSSYIKNPLADKHAGFSAGSFRDMSRVAKLNPTMWTELMTDNGKFLTAQIDDLIYRLKEYREAIASGDEKKLYELLNDGNERKERIDKETREWKRQ